MDLTRLKFFIFFLFTKWLKVLKPSILLVGIYGIEPDIYLINFKKRAPTERILKKLFNRLLQLVPKRDLSSIFSRDSEIEYYCTYYSLSPEAPTLRKTLKIYMYYKKRNNEVYTCSKQSSKDFE